MIRSPTFRRSSNGSLTDGGREFRKAKDPRFPQLARPNRISTGNPSAGEFNEKTSANSNELRGFLSGYERFGRHNIPSTGEIGLHEIRRRRFSGSHLIVCPSLDSVQCLLSIEDTPAS